MTTESPSIVVMGVSGVGKTTVGRDLARGNGVAFVDADDLHGPSNIAKMAAGTPLDDDDRWPWLDRVGAALAADTGVVVACSALKRAYRDRLRASVPDLFFVHLDAPEERVAEQATARRGHFMPPALLASQLQTLEPLGADEEGITVTVDASPAELVERVREVLAGGSAVE